MRYGPPPNSTVQTYKHDYSEPFYHFNKIEFLKPRFVEELFPLEAYPVSNEVSDILCNYSLASSPITQDILSIQEFSANAAIWRLGGLPSIPGDPEFWSELKDVVEVQILRRNNGTPPLILPDLWSGYNISAVAEAVNNEYPGYHQQRLLESLWDSNKLTMDDTILPIISVVDFAGSNIRLAALNTWAIDIICPPNFLVKWTAGRIRPEEAAFQMAKGLYDDLNVPPKLKSLIDSMDLQTPEEFTSYVKGCPSHPSWPAMHSAGSSMSLWLPVVANLTEEQFCQTLRTDYAVATARTVAGVHYRSDNLAGLNLGQNLLAQALPQHLADLYDANETAVREKVRNFRFDWKTYDEASCSVVFTNRV
jgi:hypothetical protein